MTIRGLKLPDQWQPLVVKQEGRVVFLRLGKNPSATVTGIQRHQNEASAEFDHAWRIESGPARLASTVKDRFQFAELAAFTGGFVIVGTAEIGCVALKGKGRATLKLYDDGWRVTELRCQGGW